MKINFEFCGDVISINCNMIEKFNDVFQRYLKQTRLKMSVYILYNGNIIKENSNKVMSEIINNIDKERNEAKMLVYKNEDNDEVNDNVNVNNNKAKTSRENPQKQKEINIGLKHSYWNQDFNETNDQFKVDNNFVNINHLNSNEQKLVLVNFKFEGIYHPLNVSKQIKMGEVCERFAEIKNRKISYFKFLYQGNIIDQNKKVAEYFDNNNTNGITIIVEDNKPCYVTHKTKLIAIGSVIIGIIILAIILIVSKVAESKNKSSNSKASKTASHVSKMSLIGNNLINNTDSKMSFLSRHNDSSNYFQKKEFLKKINI